MNRGFTLIEVLIASAILVMIAVAAFSSLSSAIESVDRSREKAAELRLRQFLMRSFTQNFSTAFVTPSGDTYDNPIYQFIGESESEGGKPTDTVRFISTAPVIGASGLPGDIKEVRYSVESNTDNDSTPITEATDESTGPQRTLRAAEAPLLDSELSLAASADFDPTAQALEENLQDHIDAPGWSVPIESFDLLYFNGQDWVETWDSAVEGRLPWAVHIKINFARTREDREAEQRQGINAGEAPDFEIVVPIPMGQSVFEDIRTSDMFADTAAPEESEEQEQESESGGAQQNESSQATPTSARQQAAQE